MTRLPPTCLKGCLAFHLILSSACRTAQAGFRSYAQQKGKKGAHICSFCYSSLHLQRNAPAEKQKRNRKPVEEKMYFQPDTEHVCHCCCCCGHTGPGWCPGIFTHTSLSHCSSREPEDAAVAATPTKLGRGDTPSNTTRKQAKRFV